jgi:hypothetical protein
MKNEGMQMLGIRDELVMLKYLADATALIFLRLGVE